MTHFSRRPLIGAALLFASALAVPAQEALVALPLATLACTGKLDKTPLTGTIDVSLVDETSGSMGSRTRIIADLLEAEMSRISGTLALTGAFQDDAGSEFGFQALLSEENNASGSAWTGEMPTTAASASILVIKNGILVYLISGRRAEFACTAP